MAVAPVFAVQSPLAARAQATAPTPSGLPPATGTQTVETTGQTQANAVQEPAVVFEAKLRPFSLVRDSAAYAAATLSAPQLYALKAGTPVASVEASKDGQWIIAMTEDGQAAFLPTVDLGPYDPGKSPQPEIPMNVSGVASVVDTGTLKISGQLVPLDGVKGEAGTYARQLQDMIRSQGMQVRCELKDQGYRCLLPNGMDIARVAIFNGAAEPADDASADYQSQARAAEDAHRGMWKTRRPPAHSILPIRTGVYVAENSDCGSAPEAAMLRFRGNSFAFPQTPDCRVDNLKGSEHAYELTQSCTNEMTNASSQMTQRLVVLTETEFSVEDGSHSGARYRWCSP